MRVLKFRAWNKQKKKWMWPYPNAFHIIGEVTVFELLKQDCTSIEEYNDLVICQFTGLLDKNGVEIYEGDIVQSRQIACRNGEVILRNTAFRVHGFILFQLSDGAKVIGNVYENPELIRAE